MNISNVIVSKRSLYRIYFVIYKERDLPIGHTVSWLPPFCLSWTYSLTDTLLCYAFDFFLGQVHYEHEWGRHSVDGGVFCVWC